MEQITGILLTYCAICWVFDGTMNELVWNHNNLEILKVVNKVMTLFDGSLFDGSRSLDCNYLSVKKISANMFNTENWC